ncbi:MAG: phosphoglycolate phosphatase [Proteobacteria bacterium]|nr:phosphoglycolate phosphatase [Pseudomonadota bacterium]
MTGTARFGALILDLDGTLLDTAPDMAGALNRLRVEEGAAALPFEAVRPHVSSGAMALVRLGFGEPPPAAFERLRQRFLALYAERLSEGTSLFPGCAALLEALEARHVPWGIVTNKPEYLTRPLLARLGLLERAGCVIAGDTLPERKPHPRPLLHAAELLGRAPAGCVYVGDHARDIEAGRAAGMYTVAVRYGYTAPGEDPSDWRPDALVGAPEELLPLVAAAAA